MKNKKTPLILVMVACLCLTLAGGYYIGKSGKDTGLFKRIDSLVSETDKDDDNTDSSFDSSMVEIQPVPENQDEGYDTTEIYEKVLPSVVCINTYTGNSVSPSASGTGIVLTADGYIITNAHVISDATYLNVVFSDGDEVRADIVGYDTDTDLAVIKVKKSDLTVADFGDSTQLKIGERVVAIGNAGGLSGSCTQGIVSGLNRNVDSSRRSLALIQTSAAINPGNSGGPLVNRWGQVIGITSSKIANVDYEGIGFAIPISDALPIIESLIQNGYVTGRAVLGVSVIELNSTNGPRNGLPNYGAYIASFTDNSPLPARGVRERDVIVKANGTTITSTQVLLTELTKFSPGDDMELEIYRPESGETFAVTVKLIESTSN